MGEDDLLGVPELGTGRQGMGDVLRSVYTSAEIAEMQRAHERELEALRRQNRPIWARLWDAIRNR